MNSLVVTDTDRATLAVVTAKRDLEPAGMEPAAQCAATMIGGYPDLKVQDPAVFVRHLAALLSEYPQWLLERAWIEIPRTIPKYKLDIAGIKEWLESQMSENRKWRRGWKPNDCTKFRLPRTRPLSRNGRTTIQVEPCGSFLDSTPTLNRRRTSDERQ